MEILEYYQSKEQGYWLEQLGKNDWRAGRYLSALLGENRLREVCGEKTEVLLLVEGRTLLSFCIYAQQDEIKAPELTPWVGFVYTFPQFRGKRYAGKLLEYARGLAKKDGYRQIYISTGNIGLYEKYGCTFWKVMKNAKGEDCRFYTAQVG